MRTRTRQLLKGPIVLVITSDIARRSDAILIQRSGIKSISLPGLRADEAAQRANEMASLVRGRRNTFAHRNSKFLEHLRWLWDTTIQPILLKLYLLLSNVQSNSIVLSNIHWIGTSIVTHMPFHAADTHTIDPMENTVASVKSSYLTSLRALAHAFSRRQRRFLTQKRDTRIMVVTTPESPSGKGHPLVYAETEAASIIESSKLAQLNISAKTFQGPSVSTVPNHMPVYHICHFACHGKRHLKDPWRSHLVLQGGDFSVTQIARSHAAEADLVFLSACSTANNAEVNRNDTKISCHSLPYDEAVHIASSFQLAGFKNVVGTLWYAVDSASFEVAEEFCQRLLVGKARVKDEGKEMEGV